MKSIYLLSIFSLTLLLATTNGNAASSSKKTVPSSENTANSALRVTCDGDDVGAEVFINNKFKGECPLDIKIAEGSYKLRVVKKVDDLHENIFEQDIRMGDGVVKKVEAVLTTRLNAAGRAEAQKLDAERLSVAAAKRVRFDAALASGTFKAIFRDCPDCPEMVAIPPGSFEMGSNNNNDGKPVHSVSISQAFAVGKTEVTQGQWKAIMGNNPSRFQNCGDTCPVENVSWNDTQDFIQKLNTKTGKQYRLPSEAEWEYACRAGSQQEYCGSDDIDSVAWYEKNSSDTTHVVATKKANAFGIYDMSGNVFEWVEDGYHENYNGAPTDGIVWSSNEARRVLRGGSWDNGPWIARAAYRFTDKPAGRYRYGFRLARTLL